MVQLCSAQFFLFPLDSKHLLMHVFLPEWFRSALWAKITYSCQFTYNRDWSSSMWNAAAVEKSAAVLHGIVGQDVNCLDERLWELENHVIQLFELGLLHGLMYGLGKWRRTFNFLWTGSPFSMLFLSLTLDRPVLLPWAWREALPPVSSSITGLSLCNEGKYVGWSIYSGRGHKKRIIKNNLWVSGLGGNISSQFPLPAVFISSCLFSLIKS